MFNIPDRDIHNPLLNIQETNELLRYLRNLTSSRRQESSSYGTSILPDNPYVGNINIKFTEDLPPFSVFTIKYVDRAFYAPISTADWNDAAPATPIPTGKGLVYCTNENNLVNNGSVMDCKVIGDDAPKLIRFTGTVPTVNDRMRKKVNDTVLEKHPDGEFVATSSGDEDRGLVWVVRYYSSTETISLTVNLLRANDWMDVGGAVAAAIWSTTDGTWSTPGAAVAQDIQHRSFLSPNDQCWGLLLGFTEDEVPVYEIIGENGLHQWAKANDTVACGSEGNFQISLGNPNKLPTAQNITFIEQDATEYTTARDALAVDADCPTAYSTHNVDACPPPVGFTRQIFPNEYVSLRYIVGNRKWEFKPVSEVLMAKGTLSTAMCPNSTDVGITGLKVFGTCRDIDLPDGFALNDEDYSLAGINGRKVFAVYKGADNDWTIIQVKHQEEWVIEEIATDPGDSETCPATAALRRHHAIMTCEEEPEPVDVISFQQVDVTVAATLGECSIIFSKYRICVAGEPVILDNEELEFESVDVVTAITPNGCGLYVSKLPICIIDKGVGDTTSLDFDTVDVDVLVGAEVDDSGGGDSSVQDTFCSLLGKTKTIKVCFASEENPFQPILMEFQSQVVLRSATLFGLDIIGCFVEIFTPCIGDDWCEPIIPGEPCPEDESSSSGG